MCTFVLRQATLMLNNGGAATTTRKKFVIKRRATQVCQRCLQREFAGFEI